MTQTKEAARLTAETARVGMRVRCVDGSCYTRGNVLAGVVYTVSGVEAGGTARLHETGDYWFNTDRFIPADPQPAPAPSLRAILSDRAPDLLAALMRWHAAYTTPGAREYSVRLPLWAAIERAGLLAEPSQPAPLPAMWCGADAFTQENDDGR